MTGALLLPIVTAEMAPQAPQPLENQVIEAALTGVSAATRRVYASHIKRWRVWAAGAALDRPSVKGYIRALELQGASAQVRNQALAAMKKLAYEAGELNLIEASVAAQIRGIKSARGCGLRTGIWLSATQAAKLLATPDDTTLSGKRDRCVLALLVGCGLRRAEACSLTVEQIRTVEDGRMILTNVRGKGGRIRNIKVPVWAAQAIEMWIKELLPTVVVSVGRSK